MAPAAVHFRLLVALGATSGVVNEQLWVSEPLVLVDWVRRHRAGGASDWRPARHQLGQPAEIILAMSVLANGQAAVARTQISGSIIGTGLELAANGKAFSLSGETRRLLGGAADWAFALLELVFILVG